MKLFSVSALLLVATVVPSFGQVASSVKVISSTRSGVTIRVAPRYDTSSVVTTDGEQRMEVRFADGQFMDSAGAPGLMQLAVSMLLPSAEAAHIELVSQTLDITPNVDLAPVPTYHNGPSGVQKTYVVDQHQYDDAPQASAYRTEPVAIFRTAYSEQIILSPVQYDARSRTLTRVKEAVYRITYAHWTSEGSEAVPAAERQLFSSTFINGDRFEFYRSARSAISATIRRTIAYKPSAGSEGSWLEVETSDEGIYRISAKALNDAGITGAIDSASIELLGMGGWMLNESATDSAGEWLEHPFEIRSNGDILFYAPGVVRWKYSPNQDVVDGLYHRMNPYTSTGHFLLHVGGQFVGTPLHVVVAPDSILAPVTVQDKVFTASLHEQETSFEVPNYGRELLGEGIQHSDVGPTQITMNPPGYTGDSTTVRVGYDAVVPNGSSGYVTVRVGDRTLGRINARTGTDNQRNWDNALRVPASVTAPLTIGLDLTSNNTTSHAALDFLELMYRRTTNIGSNSIPFFLLDTHNAYEYSFSNATGGELWDVTNRTAPRVVSIAEGDQLRVQLQGVDGAMRRLIAFSENSLGTPKLSAIATPSLRSGLGQQGAQSIIIAPAAFRAAADSLAMLRRAGGQATEPLTVAVVTLEDIFQQFGYGSRDLTAIRDFLAYTFRHTVANGTTVPMYVTLLGSGHSDYQNRVTKAPNWMPVWESESTSGEYLGSYRRVIYDPYPDDAFFVRLLPHPSARELDMAIGRVSARSLGEAMGYVAKVNKYEHSSAEGDWRSLLTFVADDRIADVPDQRDVLDHFGDTEEEVKRVQNRLIVDKIYGASYATVYTSGGNRRKPTMESSIIDAMNSGTVLLSFVGHGNPHVWTHESILTVPGTINRFNNFDKLAYVTTATCDFSEYDNYEDVSGGVMLLTKPDGGAIGLLGTSRSVTSQENLVFTFYSALFGVDPSLGFGTASVGSAYMAGKLVCYSGNLPFFYLLGDPSQRLLVPRGYVTFDSVNGALSAARMLPALSPVHVVGHISRDTTSDAPWIKDFNGTVTITLYDSPNEVTATTDLPNDHIVDRYQTEGPILYRGTATVTNGVFSASFIIPKDIKFDTASAKVTALAYAEDGRSALGATRAIELTAPDSINSIIDTVGPILHPFIGSRAFQSGDDVSMDSKIIVDVQDEHGLNTSTASIGHGFIAWVDDNMSSQVDLSPGYVADQDNFTRGTATQPMSLPAGHHTLHVRAFDTFDNPGFAEVDFVAKKDAPFRLYEVTNQPNPVVESTVFRFTQPTTTGDLVDATITIYSTDGRLMRTLRTRSSESVIEIAWDGRDDAGGRVANGAYAFQVSVVDPSTGTTSNASGMCVVSH